MDKRWLSISEIATESKVPESTTRRYFSNFSFVFRSKDSARGKKFHSESVAIIARIQHLYQSGEDTDTIKEILQREFPIVMENDDEEVMEETTNVPSLATSDDIQRIVAGEIEKALEKQKHEFIEIITKQQQYIDERLAGRDERLMESMRQLQEQKQAMIEAAPTKKEKGLWWKRIFG